MATATCIPRSTRLSSPPARGFRRRRPTRSARGKSRLASPAGAARVSAELGWLAVPENHARPSGPSIELAFLRIRTAAPRPRAPVVWLAGGPGGSGTHDAEGQILPLFLEISQFADVIALDQRGMGRSQPRLDCPGRF